MYARIPLPFGRGAGVRDLAREADLVSEPHAFARRLRKSSTRPEDILWGRLRGSRFHGAKFKRQVPFDRYVADFYCHAARLVVEIDGKQHGWFAGYDDERTRTLESGGLHIVRFTNDEVCNDLESVLQRLLEELRLPFA